MRAPVSASSWWKRTSWDRVADTRRTGTVTSPKLIDPVQMACGQGGLLLDRSLGPTTFAGRGASFQRLRDRRPEPTRPRWSRSTAGGCGSPTSTRSCTPQPASPKVRSSTTTPGSRRRMLPHLEDRPSPCCACPTASPASGSSRSAAPATGPRGSDTVPLDADSDIAGVLARRASPRLVWTANLAALELHTPQARADDPWQPVRDRVRPRSRSAGRPDRLRRASRSSCTTSSSSSACARSPRRRARRACTSRSGIRPSVDAETTKGFALALGQACSSRVTRSG